MVRTALKMADDNSFSFQYSGKTPANALINVRAGDLNEFVNSLRAFLESDAPGLIAQADNVLVAGNNLASAGMLPQTQQVQVTPQVTAAPNGELSAQGAPPFSQPQAQQPAAEGGYCTHGARVKRTGTSAKGPWTGFFCPAPRGDSTQCAPQFANNR
jgi:hypothetical protein